MAELPTKKFKYQKDGYDWIFIGIIFFTLICFAAIFYGMKYLNNTQPQAPASYEGVVESFIQDRALLEHQIHSYSQDREL